MVDPTPGRLAVTAPFYYGFSALFALCVATGLLHDVPKGWSVALVLDLGSVILLVVSLVLVQFKRLTFTTGMALMVYDGMVNVAVASLLTIFAPQGGHEVLVFRNLFLLAMTMAVATSVVGRWAAVAFGSVLLVLLGAGAWSGNTPVLAEIFLFLVSVTVGTAYLLYRHRASQDRLLTDLHEAIRENKTYRDRERLAALGELSAGIAHEMKNPLNLVVNFADSSRTLLDDLEANWGLANPTPADLEERAYLLGELKQNMDDIETQGKRGVSIIQSMLGYARHESGSFQPVELNELGRECLQLAWLSLRDPRVHQEFFGTAGPVFVRGARGDLGRALVNLCSNALWSARERGRRAPASFQPEVTLRVTVEGAMARVAVQDNGLGFSPGVRERLFTPFFTTKPPGAGTGLGLSLSREVVVDQHGGRIDAEAVPQGGARFTIILPLLGVKE